MLIRKPFLHQMGIYGLKINDVQLDRIIRTFERYDYVISETYAKGNHTEDIKKRYDELMNYLNM